MSQRAASSSVAMSASLNCTAWNFEMGCPNCTRSPAYAVAMSSTAWVRLSEKRRDGDAPDLERAEELAEPHVGIADQVLVGHPDVVEVQLPGVEAAPADAPHLRSHGETGGVLLDDEAGVTSAAAPSAASVRASSVTPNDMSVPALEMKVLRPLISQPPSRRRARVRMPRASEPASGSVSPNAPERPPLGQRPQPALALGVVAEEVQRQRADRHVRLPGRGDRLVGQPDLLHGGDEADRRHADPAPLLGDRACRAGQLAHLARRSVGHRASSHADGARWAISFWAKSRHSPTRSRSDSLSEKSTASSYWTERYKGRTLDLMASDRIPTAFPEFSSVDDERRHRKQRLAAAFRLFGHFGFDEGTAGHITARDPELPDHFWVNPLGMNFKQIRVRTSCS